LDDSERLARFRVRSRELAVRFDLRAVGKAYEAILEQAAGDAAPANLARTGQSDGS
jgi:hypothetical protein